MSRQLNVLSPKFVDTVEKPGRYADGGGLISRYQPAKTGA